MVRAIAKQAEAERERRSRVIMAEGEFQAAEKMREAAMLYGSAPSAMRLRELQTLTEIAREKNMIVVTNTTAAGTLRGKSPPSRLPSFEKGQEGVTRGAARPGARRSVNCPSSQPSSPGRCHRCEAKGRGFCSPR